MLGKEKAMGENKCTIHMIWIAKSQKSMSLWQLTIFDGVKVNVNSCNQDKLPSDCEFGTLVIMQQMNTRRSPYLEVY